MIERLNSPEWPSDVKLIAKINELIDAINPILQEREDLANRPRPRFTKGGTKFLTTICAEMMLAAGKHKP